MKKLRVGVIGIGDISNVYLNNLKKMCIRDRPCSDDAAQHADDRTGQYVGRVMDAGIQP